MAMSIFGVKIQTGGYVKIKTRWSGRLTAGVIFSGLGVGIFAILIPNPGFPPTQTPRPYAISLLPGPRELNHGEIRPFHEKWGMGETGRGKFVS
jgi:hypothetical protein